MELFPRGDEGLHQFGDPTPHDAHAHTEEDEGRQPEEHRRTGVTNERPQPAREPVTQVDRSGDDGDAATSLSRSSTPGVGRLEMPAPSVIAIEMEPGPTVS